MAACWQSRVLSAPSGALNISLFRTLIRTGDGWLAETENIYINWNCNKFFSFLRSNWLLRTPLLLQKKFSKPEKLLYESFSTGPVAPRNLYDSGQKDLLTYCVSRYCHLPVVTYSASSNGIAWWWQNDWCNLFRVNSHYRKIMYRWKKRARKGIRQDRGSVRAGEGGRGNCVASKCLSIRKDRKVMSDCSLILWSGTVFFIRAINLVFHVSK